MNMLRIALMALMVQGGGAQQQPASIEGTVVKMGSGEALPDATVQLSLDGKTLDRPGMIGPPTEIPPENFHRTAKTDRNGKFIFEKVLPGEYQLIATRAGGYVPAEYGQRSVSSVGIEFQVTAGQRMTGIQLALSPTGSISGRVYDRDGEPLGRAQVQALRSVFRDGRRLLTIVQMVETNDRGEYRLFWLPPGRYFVSAKPDIPGLPGPSAGPGTAQRITDPARSYSYELAWSPVVKKRTLKSGEAVEEVYVPVYYPGTAEMQSASPIAVPAGGAVGGVDISVGVGLMPARHIRGRIIDGSNGQPMSAGVMAVPRTLEPLLNVPSTVADKNGLFDLSGALPGSYFLFSTGSHGYGMVPIEVGDKDLENIAIVTSQGFNISGRFVIDGRSRSGADPKVTDLRVASLTRDPQIIGMPNAGPSFNPPSEPDGSFRLQGVGIGDFRVTIRGVPEDGYVKSMRMGNVDVLDRGLHIDSAPESLLDIVIGANGGRIDGSVVNTRQEPLPNRTVVLVPDVRLRHRIDLYKSISTDGSGRFRMPGLTPGDYKLFAWEDVETGAWHDPDFMRLHENSGKPVQIREGSDESVQLTEIP